MNRSIKANQMKSYQGHNYEVSHSHTLCVWHTQLFKSFKFGNGSRISDEKLNILKFKYLQNKKWYKQAVKSTRTRKSCLEHADYFHFIQITDKNLQFHFKNS